MTRSPIRRTRQAPIDMHGTASLSLYEVRGPDRATAAHQGRIHTSHGMSDHTFINQSLLLSSYSSCICVCLTTVIMAAPLHYSL